MFVSCCACDVSLVGECGVTDMGWRTGTLGGVQGRTAIVSGRSTVAMAVRPGQL